MENSSENTLAAAAAARLGRRSFIKGAGMTGLGLAGAALTGARLGALDKVPGVGKFVSDHNRAFAASVYPTAIDLEVGSFALNLEYLEAEFYTVAVTGKTLAQSGFELGGLGPSGATTGGSQVDFSGDTTGQLQTIATQIMMDEQQHVMLIRSLLGSSKVAKPTINLAALGEGFANFQEFLQVSRDFEDTGVSAYGGAAPLLTSPSDLSYAVRVGLTEAYHASLIRGLISFNNVMTAALDDQDQLPPPSGTEYFPNNNQGLTTVRTTSEVLAIVYHNSASGTNSGGFFPNGVNGNINTV